MLRKLFAWLLNNCPMLGTAMFTRYQLKTDLFKEKRFGYFIPFKLANPKPEDPKNGFACIFTGKELQTAIDRWEKKYEVPYSHCLPAARGIVHREIMVVNRGGCVKQKDGGNYALTKDPRFFVGLNINWQTTYANFTKAEMNRALKRWRDSGFNPRPKWYHGICVKLVNKFRKRLEATPKPFDWNKAYSHNNVGRPCF